MLLSICYNPTFLPTKQTPVVTLPATEAKASVTTHNMNSLSIPLLVNTATHESLPFHSAFRQYYA